MYVLSIKVPIRKKSGNLFNDPCIMGKKKMIFSSFFVDEHIFVLKISPPKYKI